MTMKQVVCIDSGGYEVSLIQDKAYQAIPDAAAAAHGLIRVIDETEEDYLYPASCFADVPSGPVPHSGPVHVRL